MKLYRKYVINKRSKFIIEIFNINPIEIFISRLSFIVYLIYIIEN